MIIFQPKKEFKKKNQWNERIRTWSESITVTSSTNMDKKIEQTYQYDCCKYLYTSTSFHLPFEIQHFRHEFIGGQRISSSLVESSVSIFRSIRSFLNLVLTALWVSNSQRGYWINCCSVPRRAEVTSRLHRSYEHASNSVRKLSLHTSHWKKCST